MALPEVRMPEFRAFLVAGHGIDEADVYANSKRGTGHRRKRRRYTTTERLQAVSLILEADEELEFWNWFESVIVVGVTHFSARVMSDESPTPLWFHAVWHEPPQHGPMHLGRWTITGQLLLIGEGSETAPVTTTATLEVGLRLTGAAGTIVVAPVTFSAGMALIQPADVSVSFGLDLEGNLAAEFSRITEDDVARETEDGSVRETEEA